MTPILRSRLVPVLRVFVAAAALVFVASTSPIEAASAEFNACSQCHPEMGTFQCAGLVGYTVTACCGNSQNGWAWCVNPDWGFYVSCNGPGECNCDMWGRGCDNNWWPHPEI